MARNHQLKNEARRAEQRSDWARAIELYKSAIRLEEEGGSGSDVGVYNRVGDLYLRLGDTAEAVEYYEQAVDRYAAHGLHSSAIALCNKILRIAPDRDEVYGRLARLHASTGLLAEARSAFLRFAERMRATDRLSDALEAVQDLVSLTGDEELRTAFADQLVDAGLVAQAVAQLRLLYHARVAGGRNAQDVRERIIALDPEADPAGGIAPPAPRAMPKPRHEVPEIDLPDARPTVFPEPVPAAGPAVRLPPGDFPLDAPAPPAEPRAGPEGSPEIQIGVDGGIASVFTRFRSQVREIVEETDHAVHYDLGVAYMGMGLPEEAIGEFRLAMQSPALMSSAHALLGECLQAVGAPAFVDEREPVPVADEEGLLPLAEPDDFMLGQSVDLGVPAAEEPVEDTVSPAPPDAAVETVRSAGPSRDEEELADMLFQARLAQHRARAATEEGRADHEAHLDLARSYERMGLSTEAVRELVLALEGPAAVKAAALDVLESVASSEGIEASAMREALNSLIENGRSEVAVRAGREFVQRPRIREADRQAVLSVLPPEDALEAGPGAEPRSSFVAEALDELGDILTELDGASVDDLDDGSASTTPPTSLPTEDDPRAVFGEAEGLRAAGRMDEAESHYYRALELFEKQRDAINAIRAVDRLLALRPDDVVLHHQKNEFAIMTNDRELLISSYLDLAACLRRQNGFRSARTVYGRILDIDPSNAEARAGIAAVDADELARERRRQQQAERRAGQEVRKPVRPSAQESRERSVRAPGEFDAMFEDLRSEDDETEDGSPPDYESHYELGIAFRQMEMWDEAAREFKAALQGVEQTLPAYERLGECLLALRRYDEARRTLGVAAAQPGSEAEKAGVYFHLGVAHLRSGDRASARTYLERVLQIDPSRAQAAHLLSTLPD
jgi:tetratricopeptide (TPR) repeat protein